MVVWKTTGWFLWWWCLGVCSVVGFVVVVVRGSLKRRCLFGGSYVEQQPPAKISKLADEQPR